MVNDKHLILGLHVKNRIKDAGAVQDLLTQYGCNIKTRVGLHEVSGDFCAPNGIMLLELFGDEATCTELQTKLKAVDGLDVKKMVFEH